MQQSAPRVRGRGARNLAFFLGFRDSFALLVGLEQLGWSFDHLQSHKSLQIAPIVTFTNRFCYDNPMKESRFRLSTSFWYEVERQQLLNFVPHWAPSALEFVLQILGYIPFPWKEGFLSLIFPCHLLEESFISFSSNFTRKRLSFLVLVFDLIVSKMVAFQKSLYTLIVTER